MKAPRMSYQSNPGISWLLDQMRNPDVPLHYRIHIAGRLLEILGPEADFQRWENLAPEDRLTIRIEGIPDLPLN
jgi:hypothetical protein